MALASRATALALAALVTLPLAGCDEAITPEDSVDNLVIDARIAREDGRISDAVDLLREAFAVDASDPVVRVELASTLFSQAGFDLTDIDRIATFFLDGPNTVVAEAPTSMAKGAACPFESDPDAELFAVRDLEGYIEYAESNDEIDEVLSLLNPIIDDELRPDNFLCDGVVDGELNYDDAQALARMRAADPDLTDELLAQALAVNAAGRLINTYSYIAIDVDPVTTWYRLPGDQLGVCLDGIEEDALRAQSEYAIAELGEAVTSLDLRAQVLGSPGATADIVDLVLDAYQQVREELGPQCGT